MSIIDIKKPSEKRNTVKLRKNQFDKELERRINLIKNKNEKDLNMSY